MHEEGQLLHLTRDPLLARTRELHEALRRVAVELEALLASPLGGPLRQLPRLRRRIFPELAARLLDCLRQAGRRLSAGDEDKDRVRRRVCELALERIEVARLPGVDPVRHGGTRAPAEREPGP